MDVHLLSSVEANNSDPIEDASCSWDVIDRKINAIEDFGNIWIDYSSWGKYWMGEERNLWDVRFERTENPEFKFSIDNNTSICEGVDKMYKRVTSYGFDKIKRKH